EPRGAPLAQRCDDVFDRSLRCELDRRTCKAKPFGAQPHLRHSFLAGNINSAVARAGKRRRHLDQQRRLANARVAAEQQHRATYEPAAGDAVELGNVAGETRGVVRLAGERLEREWAPLARRLAWELRARGGGILLGDRIPLAAGVALALPAAVGGAAVLAHK